MIAEKCYKQVALGQPVAGGAAEGPAAAQSSANPDPPGTPNQRSSWKLVDQAGCRGLRVGGAQVSEKHCNFLINTGDATAADIEALRKEYPPLKRLVDFLKEKGWETR